VKNLGTVQVVFDERGFGFIRPDNGGEDVFFHIKEVKRAGLQPLQIGDRIAFDIERDERTGKTRAVDLAPGRRVEGIGSASVSVRGLAHGWHESPDDAA